jgi:predicted SAM-dependent methyltransferase
MSSPTSSVSTSADARLLHLGCGLFAPQEWVNVDGSRNAWLAQHPTLKKALVALRLVSRQQAAVPWPTNITIADLRGRLPFPDNSFDAVFSSHTVEHLHRDEALRLLRESFRVLKPGGGRCRTLVPDLRTIVREYLGETEMKWFSDEEEARLRQDPAHRLCARLLMRPEDAPRGGNVLLRMYRAATDHHHHKWLYDAPSLVRLMSEAGFVDCRERGYLETEIPHLDKVETAGRVLNGVGVAVEGRKP